MMLDCWRGTGPATEKHAFKGLTPRGPRVAFNVMRCVLIDPFTLDSY